MRNSLFVIFPWYSSHSPMIFLYTPNIWMIFTSMFPWHLFGRSQTIATPAVQVIAPPRGFGEPWMAAFSWSLGQQRWGMKPTIVGVQWEIRGIIYVCFLGMMWVRDIKLYDQQWGVQSGNDGIACYDRSIEISRYIFMNWNWMHCLILNGVTCGKMSESHHEHAAWRCYHVKWVVIQQQMSVYISSNARMEPVNVGKLTMTQWGALTWFVQEWRNLVTRCKLTTMSKRNMISQNPTLFSWLEVLDPQSWIEPTAHDLTWSHYDSPEFGLRLTSMVWKYRLQLGSIWPKCIQHYSAYICEQKIKL